jgi:hypothetical protein
VLFVADVASDEEAEVEVMVRLEVSLVREDEVLDAVAEELMVEVGEALVEEGAEDALSEKTLPTSKRPSSPVVVEMHASPKHHPDKVQTALSAPIHDATAWPSTVLISGRDNLPASSVVPYPAGRTAHVKLLMRRSLRLRANIQTQTGQVPTRSRKGERKRAWSRLATM